MYIRMYILYVQCVYHDGLYISRMAVHVVLSTIWCGVWSEDGVDHIQTHTVQHSTYICLHAVHTYITTQYVHMRTHSTQIQYNTIRTHAYMQYTHTVQHNTHTCEHTVHTYSTTQYVHMCTRGTHIQYNTIRTHVYTRYTHTVQHNTYTCVHAVHTYVHAVRTHAYTQYTHTVQHSTYTCVHAVHTYVLDVNSTSLVDSHCHFLSSVSMTSTI